MASPQSVARPAQWDALSLGTLRERLRSLALQRERVRQGLALL